MSSLSTALDRYLAIALDSLTKGHVPAILDQIQPGEIGCCACGHVAPSQAFISPPRRHDGRLCPSCGSTIEQGGYLSGDIMSDL